MHYQSHLLSNGLRIIHLPSNSPVSYCGFGVASGTRDELAREFGMAHFVEHMLFKGTDKRRAWHILNRMENVGGELNAYTTKEETFVYSIFMEEHVGRAIELLSDLVFNSRFPEKELEKELDVVLDEINSYKDNPSELIYDEFENLLFKDHALGHNILGEESTLNEFDRDLSLSFYHKHYVASNMIFFSMGSTPFKKIVRMVESYCKDMPEVQYKNDRVAPLPQQEITKVEVKDTFQAHAFVGGRSYSMYDERRTGLFLLNNILGGPGMNSRLNIALREKNGLVYNVESNLTPYTDTGVFGVYFGCDQKNLDKCLSLLHKELRKLRENKLSTSQILSAKRQLIGQLGVSGDNKESTFLGLGKSFMHYNRYDTIDEVFKRIEVLDGSILWDIANDVFDESKLYTLLYKAEEA